MSVNRFQLLKFVKLQHQLSIYAHFSLLPCGNLFVDLIALIALVLDKSPDFCACTAGLELLHHEP